MKVAIIGGGASGMMSAYWSAIKGAEVTLYERNEKLGKKVYITGKGRCNLTNLTDNATLLSNVVSNEKFLMASFAKWSSADTYDFFESIGLPLKVERGNRVFPQSDKASDVTKVLERQLLQLGVDIRYNCRVLAIECQENAVLVSTITDIVEYDAIIIACGGVSYKTTGSDGDGYKLAKSIGHNIVQPTPALCEILLKQDVDCLNGISLKNVRLTAIYNKKVIFSEIGEMLFTYKGISGPLALSLSSFVNRLPLCQVKLYVDFKPGLPLKSETTGSVTIESRIARDFEQLSNKSFKNSLVHLLPARMAEYVVARCKIDEDKKINSLTAVERSVVVDNLKHLSFDISQLSDIDYGIVTAGGVDVKQINPSTMQSKICKRVFFAGEVIDVDALTGGFNLQIAFSTAYVAGNSIVDIFASEEQ